MKSDILLFPLSFIKSIEKKNSVPLVKKTKKNNDKINIKKKTITVWNKWTRHYIKEKSFIKFLTKIKAIKC